MTQQAEIRFGTDGWRALIAEDYTYANVARCAQGLCDYMKRRGTAERGLIVGYDTRFLSPEFAATVAGVAASQGIRTMLADRSAPTPVLSYNVLHHAWPVFAYVIVSVEGGEPGALTSWRLREDRSAFDEEPVAIEETTCQPGF